MNKPEFVTEETIDFPKYYWAIYRNPSNNVVSAIAKSETDEEGYQFALGLDLNSLGSNLTDKIFHEFPYIAIPTEFTKEIGLLKKANIIRNEFEFVTAIDDGTIVLIYKLRVHIRNKILEYEAFERSMNNEIPY